MAKKKEDNNKGTITPIATIPVVEEEIPEEQQVPSGSQDEYTCACGFGTPDSVEFRNHLLEAGRQDGKGVHKSLRTKGARALKGNKEKQVSTTIKTTTTVPKTTTNPLNAAIFQLVTQTGSIVNTPDIRQSYLCALKYNFPGDITAFLGMAAVDYWYGRAKDPYREVQEWLGEPEAAGELAAIAKGGNHG